MESGPQSEENVSYSAITAKKAQLQSMLLALLDDPILLDVPRKPTLADVDTLINLELGSAMKITISKMDNTSFDVAVLNTATVNDLKLAIRKKVNEMEQAKMGHRHISWRHVWTKFCLSHHNEKLVYENSLLSEYGIRNNSKARSVAMMVALVAAILVNTINQCIFFHALLPGPPRNILRGGNTVSSMD